MNQKTASLAMACTGGTVFLIVVAGTLDATQLLRFIALLLAASTFWRGLINYMDRCPDPHHGHGGHGDHADARRPVHQAGGHH